MNRECYTSAGVPKLRFSTRAAAKDYSRARQADGRVDMSGQKPYFCSRCGWFHLGHYPAHGLRRRTPV